MSRTSDKPRDWIFSVLVGKKKEEIFYQDNLVGYEIDRISQCVESASFTDGITQEYAEKVLRDNAYIGMNAYRYIYHNYNQENKCKITFKQSEQLRIQLQYEIGKGITIFIPMM